jgi:hypothetical protein
MLGAATDGSRVYYATGAGLFLRDGPSTREISPAADATNYPPAVGAARVSADGSRLAFVSDASLTGYDNTDPDSGQPQVEVYLYETSGAGTLICASCNPRGLRPIGPSNIPGTIANGSGPGATRVYRPRPLTAGGQRLFFESGDALVVGDTNGERDVYEWEAAGTGSCSKSGGCLELISGGRGEDGARFVDASESGADVFFLTGESLVPSDLGAVDLYDARIGGGFPLPPPPVPCEGDACQPLPSPPQDPTPGTLLPGAPNPPITVSNHSKAQRHKKQQRGKHRKGKRKAKPRGGRR